MDPSLGETVRSQGSGHSKERECECQGCSHEDPRSSLLPAWLWCHETFLQEPFSFHVSLIPGSGTFPGIGNGNPLQYSCLESPRDGGAWWAAVYGVAQSRTRLKRLSSSINFKQRMQSMGVTKSRA